VGGYICARRGNRAERNELVNDSLIGEDEDVC